MALLLFGACWLSVRNHKMLEIGQPEAKVGGKSKTLTPKLVTWWRNVCNIHYVSVLNSIVKSTFKSLHSYRLCCYCNDFVISVYNDLMLGKAFTYVGIVQCLIDTDRKFSVCQRSQLSTGNISNCYNTWIASRF